MLTHWSLFYLFNLKNSIRNTTFIATAEYYCFEGEQARQIMVGVANYGPRLIRRYLQDRFLRLLDSSTIPARQDPNYNKALRQRHAAILGICALVDSYPYTIEKWMPELLTNVLAEHTYDPVSWTIRLSPPSCSFCD